MIALSIALSKENLEKAFGVLDRFCAGSGAKMNLGKSTALWCSNNPRDWTYGEDRGPKQLAHGMTTLNLGFPIGVNMSQHEKNAKVLTQIRNKLAQWSSRKLSMAARVLVSNQVVLASIWYIASGADISKSILAKARALVRNFIWGGDSNKRT